MGGALRGRRPELRGFAIGSRVLLGSRLDSGTCVGALLEALHLVIAARFVAEPWASSNLTAITGPTSEGSAVRTLKDCTVSDGDRGDGRLGGRNGRL